MNRFCAFFLGLLLLSQPLSASRQSGDGAAAETQVTSSIEVGVCEVLARVYDPQMGRFLSADPVIQDPNNLQCYNRYSYCTNNPLKYVDPNGYEPINAPYLAASNAIITVIIQENVAAPFCAGIAEGVTEQGNAQANIAAYQMMATGPSTSSFQMAAAAIDRNQADLDSMVQAHTDSGISEDSSMRVAARIIGRNSDLIVSLVGNGAGPVIGYAKSRLNSSPIRTALSDANQATLKGETSITRGDVGTSLKGKAFTAAQKRDILAANRGKNGGVLKSDKSGTELVQAQKSQKGITPPDNEAQVDHIYPRSKGGQNSQDNAQILSRKENIQKGDKLPDEQK
jgi:RHS repeat-associated protein